MSKTKTTVEQILFRHGYMPDGMTSVDRVMTGTKQTFTVGNRDRFRMANDPSRRVTMGGDRVCFYRVVNQKAGDFRNFDIWDIDGIQGFLTGELK